MEELPAAWGPGNVVLLEVESEQVTEVFSSVGRRGTPAERVARDAAAQAVRYLDAKVPVGDCLADQILLPFAVAGKGSYVTLPLTRAFFTVTRADTMESKPYKCQKITRRGRIPDTTTASKNGQWVKLM